MRPAHLITLLVSLLLLSHQTLAAPPAIPLEPVVAPASNEAAAAMKGIQLADGLEVRLFAAEPLVANPVAFTVGPDGALYVVESFRQNRGVTDNRGHDQKWLDDDLAAQTVEDRIAYHRKHLGDKLLEYTRHDDRIRRLVDSNGDGKADQATVFAKHFNQLEDGSGAGVLVHGKNVLFTCIPHLWQLRDDDGDGVAEHRSSLHYGYGVRVAFRGHDLHGLLIGPDGKLYYSIGDRGYNIQVGDRRLKDPASGAVFRCNPDGSQLEVFASGLRNPQELAFDDYGNLFTGDNNSDSGDRARWVYVVDGSDTGWRMYYQYLGDRGPFNREKIWQPASGETPAYIVPPVANLADGPSGLVAYPGTGLGDAYRGRFLLCDFRGGPANSGIRSFGVENDGAFFKVVDQQRPIWKVLATDLAFAADGTLYISDWVNGWNGEGKGRIYAVQSSDKEIRQQAQATGQLIQQEWGELSEGRTMTFLTHIDRRVRQAAQFELAGRKATMAIARALADSTHQLQKIHLLWALQQIGQQDVDRALVVATVASQLDSSDAELRAQAARVLGELQATETELPLISLLDDDNLRTRHLAAIALGRIGSSSAAPALLAMLAANKDADPIVRHSGIMGLVGGHNNTVVLDAITHPSPAVRRAIAVVLRRWQSPEIVQLLNDSEPSVVTEAARAIHDLPIEAGYAALAELIQRPALPEHTTRRVLNANFRLAGQQQANRLAEFAARPTESDLMRMEALDMLAHWATPSNRDRVLGDWRPLPERSIEIARSAVRSQLPALLDSNQKIVAEALDLAASLGIREVESALRQSLATLETPADQRARALAALGRIGAEQLDKLVQPLLSDESPRLRAAAHQQLASYDAAAALKLLARPTRLPTRVERQQAMSTLAGMASPSVDNIMLDAINRLYFPEQVPADMRLDIQLAASSRKSPQVQSALKFYRQSRRGPLGAMIDCLEGGDIERGREIFLYRTEVSCVRCHKAAGRGGDVGPPLDRIGADKDLKYLLEAVLLPNAAIAKGFQSVSLIDHDGRVLSGVVRSENDTTIELISAEGRRLTIPKDQVDVRKEAKSPMPEDLAKRLSTSDIRDLVAFLASLKAAPQQP